MHMLTIIKRTDKTKQIILSVLLLIFLLPSYAVGGDVLKVLMLESPNGRLPSEEAEIINNINGKVFINGHSYEGVLEIIKDKNGLYVINHLPVEKYIEEAVASEISDDWEIEAVKAQAVISRSFAFLHKTVNADRSYHLPSNVFNGFSDNNTNPTAVFAAKQTNGEILTYNNVPITAYSHQSCNGKTELPEEVWGKYYPYAKSVNCNSSNSPYEIWQRKYTREELGNILGIHNLKNVNIASYTSTGRVKTIGIVTETDESMSEISAVDLRTLLGQTELPSTQFSLTTSGNHVIFDGKGHGHGVGLCQWGAIEMARQGKNYREILEHYYPGTKIQQSTNAGLQALKSE